MKQEQFKRWFNRSFWRAFRDQSFPIRIPETPEGKAALIDKVYTDILSARYAPSIPEAEIVMNKGHGVARTKPVFCIEDYCVYYFCIKELEDILCVNRTPNTFGGWSLGGRFRRQENADIECELTEYGRYSFNPRAWTQAFGEFNSLLFAQLDRGNYSHVLQFDLSNFYDCVRLDMLERWIREAAGSEKGWLITLLFYLLNQWNRRNTGLHPQSVGLPQDVLADCSRILANYYLQQYDHFAGTICSSYGALYFRYADDQMILLNDPLIKEKLLLLLTRRLDRFGLRVNQKKVELSTAPELQAHRCREIQAIFSTTGDSQDPSLVRRFVDAYLAIPKAELAGTWNQGLPLLNRLLWANLESLPRSAFEAIVTRLASEEFLLCADDKKLARVNQLNSKRTRPIDFSSRLRRIGQQCVHNSYHYGALAYAKSVQDADLRVFCMARLAALDQLMAGTGGV